MDNLINDIRIILIKDNGDIQVIFSSNDESNKNTCTIDNVDDMRHLIELGVDVIMTDRPDLLYTLLKDEYNCR